MPARALFPACEIANEFTNFYAEFIRDSLGNFHSNGDSVLHNDDGLPFLRKTLSQ